MSGGPYRVYSSIDLARYERTQKQKSGGTEGGGALHLGLSVSKIPVSLRTVARGKEAPNLLSPSPPSPRLHAGGALAHWRCLPRVLL